MGTNFFVDKKLLISGLFMLLVGITLFLVGYKIALPLVKDIFDGLILAGVFISSMGFGIGGVLTIRISFWRDQ
jgi:hypothetical protein